MRSNWKVPALSLAVVLVSCGSPQEPAPAVTASTELAPAPQSYQRARFVSPIEQSRAGVPARRPAPAVSHAEHVMTSHEATYAPAPEPAAQPVVAAAVATLEADLPTAVVAPTVSAPEPSIVILQGSLPSEPEPIRVSRPSGPMIGDDGLGGMGGVIGPTDGIGGAIIRGGHGGRDKCDPRLHGRPQIPTSDRPTFRMPSFPSGRR